MRNCVPELPVLCPATTARGWVEESDGSKQQSRQHASEYHTQGQYSNEMVVLHEEKDRKEKK
jgi:hypothetical protein